MLHTKFHGNRPAGSGDFLRVFTIYGRGGHLGHVTSIMSADFHFLVPQSFHTKFEFFNVHDLGPRSINDLDLQNPHYLHIFN